MPRLLVAILATTSYWQTNPLLVIGAWFWAIGGESTEKRVINYRVFRRRPSYHYDDRPTMKDVN